MYEIYLEHAAERAPAARRQASTLRDSARELKTAIGGFVLGIIA